MAQLRNKFKTAIGRQVLGPEWQEWRDWRNWNDEKQTLVTRWVVELRGGGDGLQQMLEQFSSCEPDRCPRGFHVRQVGRRVFLQANRFNGCGDVAVVREMALRLVHVMNGILRAQVASHPTDGVQLGAIYRERVDDNRMPVTNSEQDARPPFNARVPVTSRLWRLVQENPDVEAALSLYGSPGSPWSKLYGIYKILEPNLNEIGGQEERQAIEQHAPSFLWTVQNYAGVENLNQKTPGGVIPPAGFMSLTEARVYIHTLLERWLALKSRHLAAHSVVVI